MSDALWATLDALFRATCLLSGERAPLSALVSVTNGVSYRSVDLAPSRTALVTLKSVDRRGGYKTDGLKEYVGAYKPTQEVAPGELLVAQTDITQGAEVVGRAIRVPGLDGYDHLVASLDLLIVRPREHVPPEYLTGLLRRDEFREHCRSHTSGTTVLHLASDTLARYDAWMATPERRESFADDAAPLLAMSDSLSRQISLLVALRDALLPELLSGRIRVPEARERVEAVV